MHNYYHVMNSDGERWLLIASTVFYHKTTEEQIDKRLLVSLNSLNLVGMTKPLDLLK